MQPSLLVPGEQLTFEISLRGVLAGEAVTAVGEPGTVDGREVIVMQSRIESAGVVAVVKEVRDSVTTWIDLKTAVPIRYNADVKFGKKESLIDSDMGNGEGGAFVLEYERKGRPRIRVVQQVPNKAPAYDAHSALGALRAWQVSDGATASFHVLAGRRLWRNSIRFAGRETIHTSLGRFPAIRIDGVAQRVNRSARDDANKKPRHYTMWLTDDANRLPILVLARTEYGDVRVELVDYARPDQSLASSQP